MSGVISPTNLSLFSSPSAGGNHARTITPNQQHGNNNNNNIVGGGRGNSVSVPRWNTGSFIALDDNMDYSMMSPLIAGGGQDHQGPPLMDDGECLIHKGYYYIVLLIFVFHRALFQSGGSR